MIVLGLNGWTDWTHDPSAALVVDGELVAFIEEERLNRVRHAPATIPRLAVQWVLREAGIALDDVDAVAYGWNLPRYRRIRNNPWDLTDREFISAVTGMEPRRTPKMHWVNHHEAHAASVYLRSGLPSAAVLVVDGRGDDESISVFHGRGHELELVRAWPFHASLGIFYREVSVHCGFGRFDGGKTMGLASYAAPVGEPALMWRDGDIVSAVEPRHQARDVHKQWRQYLADRFGPGVRVPTRYDELRSRPLSGPTDADALKPHVAAWAQETVNTTLESLANFAIQSTGERALCVSGGVALNCVANGRLVERGFDLHLGPTPDDSGVALGAALLVAARAGDPVRGDLRADLGPRYDSAQVGAYLAELGWSAQELDDPAGTAVERLGRGQVLGWFQGRAEAGPRALGHRSILALPAIAGHRDHVNLVKRREQWRPFAPALLADESRYLFGRDIDSPYMQQSFTLTDQAVIDNPAITHVDKTARPQTVRPGTGRYADLLGGLREQHGHGVVLNTSFNGPGEPIVCTPEDALRAFASMPLDALIIENHLVEKKNLGR